MEKKEYLLNRVILWCISMVAYGVLACGTIGYLVMKQKIYLYLFVFAVFGLLGLTYLGYLKVYRKMMQIEKIFQLHRRFFSG